VKVFLTGDSATMVNVIAGANRLESHKKRALRLGGEKGKVGSLDF